MNSKICWAIFALVFAVKNVIAIVNTKEFLDPMSAEDSVIIWQNLFIKINNILNETTKLNANMDKLNARQNNLELKLTKFMEQNENQLLDLKNGLNNENVSITNLMLKVQQHSSDLEKVSKDQRLQANQTWQSAQKYFKNFVQGQNDHKTAVIQFMQKTQQNFEELQKAQTEQNATLNQLKGNEQIHFKELEKRQDEHKNATTQFTENAQKHFQDLKKGQSQNVRNLITLIDQSSSIINPWTTVLRRQDGSVNFNRNWTEYQKGFGNTNGEFFIGLDKLHDMTNECTPKELLIVLKDFDDEVRYANYDLFQIGNEDEKYILKDLGKYSGNAGDSFITHKGIKFSTPDQDNDEQPSINCAEYFNGGWWFHTCYNGHLSGLYRTKNESRNNGIEWYQWKYVSLEYAEMKIRNKVSCIKMPQVESCEL